MIAALATIVIGVKPASWALRLPRIAEPFSGLLGHIFNPWAVWDGVWYTKIASSGYADSDGSTAFFPLYPLIIRWVGVLFGNNLVLAGMAVSLVCYLVAVWLLFRLVEREFGERIATRTILYLSIFPTAFFWQAVYSESLFLMLSVACFSWSRQGRWRLAGLAGLLAALTRSTGFMLLLPMALCYLEQRDWNWRRIDSEAASLLMVPEGLMVWMAYLSLGFSRPLLFAQVQDNWRRTLAAPNVGLFKGVQAAVQGLRQLVSGQTAHRYWPAPNPGAIVPLAYANLVNLTAVMIAVLAMFYGLRRLPLAYSAYAVAMVAYPLCFPARYMPLMSMPRFVLVVFPLFMSLALFTAQRRWAHIMVVALSLAALTVLTAKFAIFSWVA